MLRRWRGDGSVGRVVCVGVDELRRWLGDNYEVARILYEDEDVIVFIDVVRNDDSSRKA